MNGLRCGSSLAKQVAYFAPMIELGKNIEAHQVKHSGTEWRQHPTPPFQDNQTASALLARLHVQVVQVQ